MHEKFKAKRCMHAEGGGELCGKIIEAHTIQRSNTLAAICDKGSQVLSFHPLQLDQDELPRAEPRGWKKASTFNGFCSHHDSTTFSSIERFPILPISAESAFLLCYRALCHELYQKYSAAAAQPDLLANIVKGLSEDEQQEIFHRLSVHQKGVESAIQTLEAVKEQADRMLLSSSFGEWSYIFFSFSGAQCFASTASTTPTLCLNGTKLQNIGDPEVRLEHLYISVVHGGSGPMVVLGWNSKNSSPIKWVTSLLQKGSDNIPPHILQYVFAHIENVYFSAQWWESLLPEEKETIRTLAIASNSYFFPPAYSGSPTVPWRFETVTAINCEAELTDLAHGLRR